MPKQWKSGNSYLNIFHYSVVWNKFKVFWHNGWAGGTDIKFIHGTSRWKIFKYELPFFHRFGMQKPIYADSGGDALWLSSHGLIHVHLRAMCSHNWNIVTRGEMVGNQNFFGHSATLMGLLSEWVLTGENDLFFKYILFDNAYRTGSQASSVKARQGPCRDDNHIACNSRLIPVRASQGPFGTHCQIKCIWKINHFHRWELILKEAP